MKADEYARIKAERQAEADQWRRDLATHQFVTLDGEEYSCTWCDSKTGNGICPGDGNDHVEYQLASKGEMEADQLTDYGQAIYEYDGDDNDFS